MLIIWQHCVVFMLKLVWADYEFAFYLYFYYSFLRLDLSWKGIGRFKHMNLKSFGQSIALIDQMKALLISVGGSMQSFWCVHNSY